MESTPAQPRAAVKGVHMSGTRRTRTAVVTEQAAQSALRRGAATELDATEERALRMRLGASLPLSARLERVAVATDAEIELLAYEIEGFLKLKERRAAVPPPARAAAPAASRTKEKIVRALRKKS
jgi:hypothetical protein